MAEELKTVNEIIENDEENVAIKITGLKKRYRLGLITAGTLRGDLQSWWARIRGKEDPNLKIGAKVHSKNEIFMALDGIDLTIYKGERIGIIGHNGAGKSTLLKLLARVTGPTEGEIKIDGRITSMLEVGTGFNGELTGRENVYLNGAILGMTKAEVDKKMDKIIEFSECKQFIDTPVKRYSSGMFVKLAFSVAAHLDSEIMIMDEVLAVGDVNFQKKCLEKMSEVSKDEGKTILYVSHNMHTIRQLCSRCIVLDHGKVIFNGDVEQAISVYTKVNKIEFFKEIDLTTAKRYRFLDKNRKVSFTKAEFLNTDTGVYYWDDVFKLKLDWQSDREIKNTVIRVSFCTPEDGCLGSYISEDCGETHEGLNSHTFEIPLRNLAPNTYKIALGLMEPKDGAGFYEHDIVLSTFYMEVKRDVQKEWRNGWGRLRITDN